MVHSAAQWICFLFVAHKRLEKFLLKWGRVWATSQRIIKFEHETDSAINPITTSAKWFAASQRVHTHTHIFNNKWNAKKFPNSAEFMQKEKESERKGKKDRLQWTSCTKLQNECETKMDCVKRSWKKHTASKYFFFLLLSLYFALLFDCLCDRGASDMNCLVASGGKRFSILVHGVCYSSPHFFNILFFSLCVHHNICVCVCVLNRLKICVLRKNNYFR